MDPTATAHASGDKVCIRIGDEQGGRSVEIAPERAVELIRELTDAACAALAARRMLSRARIQG
jgi:hypothetical protein